VTGRPKSISNIDPSGTEMCHLIYHCHKPLLEGLEFKNLSQEDAQEDVASPAACSSHRRKNDNAEAGSLAGHREGCLRARGCSAA